MKAARITAFLLTLLLLPSAVTGCRRDPDGPPSLPAPSTATDAAAFHPENITLDLPAEQFHTWSDLYDYLESPLRSGSYAFRESEGEYIALYDTDWQTVLSGWTRPLKQDMMVIRYTGDDSVLCRYYVNLTQGEAPYSSQPESTPAVSTPWPAADGPRSDDASAVHRPVAVPAPAAPGASESAPAASTPAPGASEPAAPQPARKLSLTIYGDASLDEAIAAFNNQSRTVSVKRVDDADGMSAHQLQWLLGQNTRPDLIIMDRSEMAAAAARGLLTDLSALGADRLETRFDPSCWSRSAVSGVRYGLPLGCVTVCLACNEELLYQCGVEIPADFGAMLQNARTAREELPSVTPLGLVTDGADASALAAQFVTLLRAYGGDVLTPDHRRAAFNSPQGLAVLELYASLAQNGLISQGYRQADLLAGKTVYGPVASTQYDAVFGRMARANFSPAPLLLPGESSAGGPLALYNICVPDGGSREQTAAAYAFLSFLYSDPAWSVLVCQKAGWIPALTQARADAYYQTDAWKILLAAADNARPAPAVDGYEAIEGYLAEAVTAVLAGEDPARALQTAAEKTDNRLARG